jgi:hypothetical protein
MNITNLLYAWKHPLDAKEKVGAFIELSEKLGLNCIPVFKNGAYLGGVSTEDIEVLAFEDPLENYSYVLKDASFELGASLLDVLRSFANFETSVLFALDENRELVGYLEIVDFLSICKETPLLSFGGDEIIVRKKRVDFTYSQLVQIIESNSAKIIGMFTLLVDAENIEISLRIDHSGLNEVLQSLRRYDYEIVSIHKEDLHTEILRDNSEYFEKYLNI